MTVNEELGMKFFKEFLLPMEAFLVSYMVSTLALLSALANFEQANRYPNMEPIPENVLSSKASAIS